MSLIFPPIISFLAFYGIQFFMERQYFHYKWKHLKSVFEAIKV